MENLEQKEVIGTMRTYIVRQPKRLLDILKEMGLESKFFAVIMNGKTVKIDETIPCNAEITILPKIAGG